jgi:hypothetical protein
MKVFKILTVWGLMIVMFATSCTKKLDTKPIDPLVTTSATLFDKPGAYKDFLAKLYGSLALSGQKGQFGAPEIQASDEGTTCFCGSTGPRRR